MKDIQSRLDTAVEKRCEQEFKAAVKKCIDIMMPFYRPFEYTNYKCDLDKQREDFAKAFFITAGGYVHMFEDSVVPLSYIKFKQDEESDEFIKKVTLLRQDVDSLLGAVEDIERSR